MKPIAYLLTLLTLAGCASDPLQLENEPSPSEAAAQVRSAVGDVFRLKVGEVASVSDAALLVAFHGVESDSRCPSNVTCVWAGDAGLTIGTTAPGGKWTWSVLHTTLEPKARRTGSFTVEVVGLEPTP